MLILAFVSLLLHCQSVFAQTLDVNGISLAEKVLAIERLMLTPGTIDFQVAPCEFVLNGPPPGFPGQAGDQTAAQWVRTVFHDFITANKTAGTGGLDASIGFEADRPENLGKVFPGESFIDRTIIGFNLFSTVFISTADFIALGLAEAVLSCDPASPMIKLRAGRIDAKEAGPLGVPGPLDPFPSQKAAFARAGFTPTEMIQAVACGHSIGGVHGVNFPEIVGTQPTFGSSEVDYFDDTPFVFDNVGVKKYLDGTGKAGGPLVTTSNSAARSDFNIFNSDGNTTIKALAKTQATFESTCFTIFEKMINTVPSSVTLSDVIGPRKWITMDGYLDLTATNAVTYNGVIGTFSKTAMPNTASYTYGKTTGGNVGTKTSQVGIPQAYVINNITDSEGHNFYATRFPFFGNTTFYPFSDTIASNVNSLVVQGSYTEAINQKLFIVPSLSYANFGAGPKYLVRAALLTTLAPAGTKLNATLYYAAGQVGSTSPTYKQASVLMTSYTTKGAYTIFQGTIVQPADIPANGGGASHIDVKLGTTLRSPKAKAIGAIGKSMFASCSNDDLTTCPSQYV